MALIHQFSLDTHILNVHRGPSEKHQECSARLPLFSAPPHETHTCLGCEALDTPSVTSPVFLSPWSLYVHQGNVLCAANNINPKNKQQQQTTPTTQKEDIELKKQMDALDELYCSLDEEKLNYQLQRRMKPCLSAPQRVHVPMAFFPVALEG